MHSGDKNLLLEEPGNPGCPVKSFEIYVAKLNPQNEAFFQGPLRDRMHPHEKPWYRNQPTGVNTLAKMMKNISKAAGLSLEYTNHCVQGTATTNLHRAGFNLREIQSVTKHKNMESLTHYVEKPTLQKKMEMAAALSNFKQTSPIVESPQLHSPLSPPPPKISKLGPSTSSRNIVKCSTEATRTSLDDPYVVDNAEYDLSAEQDPTIGMQLMPHTSTPRSPNSSPEEFSTPPSSPWNSERVATAAPPATVQQMFQRIEKNTDSTAPGFQNSTFNHCTFNFTIKKN